ncbi:MAG TPA: HAD family hydrolase [Candidatus Acidoferrales bacterium]|nr:HAD family hydrolase [Candidatus Acidoferrales bacterium]
MPLKSRRISARGILFDWDGTLLDSFEADMRAYEAMFLALGIAWTRREIARHYSPDWYRVYEAARIPRARWDEADELWGRAYRREEPKLLPGAKAVVGRLRRSYELGLVTSGDRARVRRQLHQFGFSETFRACVCSEDAAHRKPHPAPLELAMSRMKLEPASCVYVGDAPEDVEMARRANVRVVGVMGPFPTARRMRAARPDAVIESIEALPEVLARFLAGVAD